MISETAGGYLQELAIISPTHLHQSASNIRDFIYLLFYHDKQEQAAGA
jgi:hypothetical protein